MSNRYKSHIAPIVGKLRQSREDFELLTAQDTIVNTEWLENNFPILSAGRIDWSKVPNSLCIRYSSESELIIAFNKIVSEWQLEGNLIVSWTNALTLPIKIDMNVMKKYAEEIFQEDWETWICNDKDKWLIENYHDGEICWGKCVTTN